MDVYPATVTLPDGTEHRKVKMVVRQGATTLWTWDPAARTGALLLEVEALPSSAGFRIWQLPADEDQRILVRHAGGCGCGDPLKRWMPGPRPVIA